MLAGQQRPVLDHSSPVIAAAVSKAHTSSETPASTEAGHSQNPESPPRAAQPADESVAQTRDADQTGPLLTIEQLQRIAEAGGRRLQLHTLGPFYRITCNSTGACADAARCIPGGTVLRRVRPVASLRKLQR